ncbi:hypothetical protein AHiyo8_52070 [Arthrobacter sp. Hiyo8]|nr:hypothetical protein AHiyo8_52070 [Arthrobacter sp. Hiyo8]
MADLSGNLDDPWINENSSVVASLFEAANGGDVEPEPIKSGRFPNLDERDPPKNRCSWTRTRISSTSWMPSGQGTRSW